MRTRNVIGGWPTGIPRPAPRCEGCRHWRKQWFAWGPDARVCLRYVRVPAPTVFARGNMAPCGPEGNYFEKATFVEAILSRPWLVTAIGLTMLVIGLYAGGFR